MWRVLSLELPGLQCLVRCFGFSLFFTVGKGGGLAGKQFQTELETVE